MVHQRTRKRGRGGRGGGSGGADITTPLRTPLQLLEDVIGVLGEWSSTFKVPNLCPFESKSLFALHGARKWGAGWGFTIAAHRVQPNGPTFQGLQKLQKDPRWTVIGIPVHLSKLGTCYVRPHNNSPFPKHPYSARPIAHPLKEFVG